MGKNISWRTTKTPSGYKWEVYEIISHSKRNKMGNYASFKTLKKGIRSTRTQARGIAQRWVNYLKFKSNPK